MSELKFSIIIPYKKRLANLRLAIESLAEQTMGRHEFEVVLGVMEYSEDYLALCREFAERLNIQSVLSSREWQTGYARNLAMRQATGEVLLLMDADMVLPPSFLTNLYERQFRYGQNICAVGQMIDYDNDTIDRARMDAKPFDHYRNLLRKLESGQDFPRDPRLGVIHVVPWAFAWTALIALRLDLVQRQRLYFDCGFRGYGVEDLEWAYRVCATGTPITMRPDMYGIHLPHERSVGANRRSEAVNYRYFLEKWPGPDVELACAFGDFEANRLYLEFVGELHEAAGGPDLQLGVVVGEASGVRTVVVGATIDAKGRLVDDEVASVLDVGAKVRILPIAGLALPWADRAFASCRLMPRVARLGHRYRERINAEAARVAATVSGPFKESDARGLTS